MRLLLIQLLCQPERDLCLSSVQITQDQVKTFLQDAEKFNQKFKEEGPACVGTDLDKGESMT